MSQWHAKSVADVAAFLGLSDRRSVQDYFKRGCPGKTDQGYDLQEIVAWVKEHIWCDKRSGGNGGDKETEELLKLRAERIIKEVKARQVIGELVSRERVRSALLSLLNQIRQRLQAIPDELASGVPPELRMDFTVDLKSKVSLILTEMSQWSQSQGVSSSPSVSPAPKKRSKTSSKRRSESSSSTKPVARSNRGKRQRS